MIDAGADHQHHGRHQGERVPRARLQHGEGSSSEWRSPKPVFYQRRTQWAEALIASMNLAGVNTRQTKKALSSLFKEAVSRDLHLVSRSWPKQNWQAAWRSL